MILFFRLLKWKSYIYIKNKYKFLLDHGINIKLIRLIIILRFLMETIFCSIITVIVLINNPNKPLFAVILLAIILICIFEGIKLSNYYYSSMDKDYLYLAIRSKVMIRFYIYFERIFLKALDYSLIITLSVVFSIYYFSNALIILVPTLVFVLCILTILFTAVLHNLYVNYLFNCKNRFLDLAKSLLIKISGFILFYFIGEKLGVWFSELPLYYKTQHINVWYKEGLNILINLEYDFKNVQLIINQIKNILNNKNVAVLILAIFFIIFLIIIIEVLHSKIWFNKKNQNDNKLGITLMLYLKLISISKSNKALNKLQFIVFFRNEFVKRKFGALFGSILYWLFIGVLAGILSNVQGVQKIYYFMLSFTLIFPVSFLVNAMYDDFTEFFSLESEQKYFYILFQAKKTLWDIFISKFVNLFSVLFPLIFIGDLLIYSVGNIKFIEFLLILCIHGLNAILFIYINYIPSIIAPNFNYINKENINNRFDKDLLKFILNIGMNTLYTPVILIPIFMYLDNIINTTTFAVSQVTVMLLIPLLMIFILSFSIRKLLIRKSSINIVINS